MAAIAILSHPDCLKHETGIGHPESAARVEIILSALKAADYAVRLDFIDAPLATPEQAMRVHDATYFQRLRELAETAERHGESFAMDADTLLSPGSWQAALRAAGAACHAVDLLLGPEASHSSAFCVARPPGHHATPDRAMGFCLLNSIAIAAAHALESYGLERVAIVDFDVHHGNGTQAAFETDSRVLYVSTHQWPHYPGTGRAEETGLGNLVNLPLPGGTNSARYREVFASQVIPALRQHQPQLLLVSAGFDAHRDDPLAGFRLTTEDYHWIGEQLAALADECSEGRILSVLEGGYELSALAESAVDYLRAFDKGAVRRPKVHHLSAAQA